MHNYCINKILYIIIILSHAAVNAKWTMKWFTEHAIVLVVLIVMTLALKSVSAIHRLPRNSASGAACQTFRDNFTAFVELADNEECRNSVRPVADLFSNPRNVTAAAMAGPAFCIPACQSLVDLEIECIGRSTVEYYASYYCGENDQGKKCYEALQSNNGTQAFDECNGNGNTCTSACAMALQDLIDSVGCCASSIVYSDLNNGNNGRSFFDTCDITIPKYCPHRFQNKNSEACQDFQRNIFSAEYIGEECSKEFLPVLGFFSNIQNVTEVRLAAAGSCITACQSLIDLQIECAGRQVADFRHSFYCGENAKEQVCYEAHQSNNGDQAFAACDSIGSGDNCTLACKMELQDVITDIGCCVNSLGYKNLISDNRCFFDKCDIDIPKSCPLVLNSAMSPVSACIRLLTIVTFVIITFF